jgi:hypothetical protein
MMRPRGGGGISHLADFSGRSGRSPTYATWRRATAYVVEKTQISDKVQAMGDVSRLGA